MRAADISISDLVTEDDKVLAQKTWTTVEKLTGLPDAGLHVLDEFTLEDFGQLGLAVITSDDFRTAIQNVVSLSSSLGERFKFLLEDKQPNPYIALIELEAKHKYTHHFVDSTIAMGIFLSRIALGKSSFGVYRVNFTHSGFGVRKRYEQRLGCPCRFNQPLNSVEFAAESLCLPMPLRNKQLHETLLIQLQTKLNNETNLVSRTNHAIHQMLTQQLWPNRQRVADMLGVGERTLLRQLQKAGTNFRDIQERVLEREAIRLLKAGFPTEKIAESLGYAGSSPLARMIRRRTGKALAELRKNSET